MKDKKTFTQPKLKTTTFNKRSVNDNQEDSLSRYKEFLKKEKSIEYEVLNQNLEKLSNCRFYMATLAGCLSGSLCLTGLYGIAFYVLMFFVFSVLLFGYIQMSKGSFFLSNANVFTQGMFTHVMVYIYFVKF